ncbi:MAG: hypothetical protein HY812_15545 [Planctomycetes bacterium]|nr:hypothetical protein [Planctomycetota bacterium]
MNRQHAIAWTAAALALASVALTRGAAAADPAVTPTAVVVEGDTVIGVGLVTFVDNLAVNNGGETLVAADTDNANTNIDSVLLKDGPTLYLQEGQLLTLPAGAWIDSFDTVNLNNGGSSGWNFFLAGTSGINDDSGVYLDTTLLIQEGSIATAIQFSPGTPYIGFFECGVNDSSQVLIVASVDDPAIATTVDRALVVVDASSGVQNVILKEGDVAPGTVEFIDDFGTSPQYFDFNNAGDAIFYADLTGSTVSDYAVYYNTALLAREGDPSPAAGRLWDLLSSCEVGMNDVGGWVLHGSIDGDTATDYIIVKNGAVYMQEGGTLPAVAPYKFTSFGSTRTDISNAGDVLWYGDWDDADTTKDEGLFVNRKLLIQEGVTQVAGMTVTDVRGTQDTQDMSDDGRYYLAEVTLNSTLDAAVLIDRGPWQILGGELAGTNGTPQLRGWGPLTGGSYVTFDLTDAKPLSTAFLILGYTPINAPFMCTTLIPYPNAIVGLPTDANGVLSFSTIIPGGLPAGVPFYMQYFISDAVCMGVSASNGIQGTLQ